MEVELRTLVAIRRRIDHAAIPRLFDDRWSARRVRARRERIDRWLGAAGRAVVGEYVYERGNPPRRVMRRHGVPQ